MRIDVFTIFPSSVDDFCSASLLGKARQSGVLDLRCHDIRDHATDIHRTVDDAPFGGGAGMLMKAEPIFAAVEAADACSTVAPARAGRPPVRSGRCCRACRWRGLRPVVRSLRGDRPPGARASRRRRAQRRRRRALRRRSRRLRGHRRRDPAAARGDGQRRQPGDGELRPTRPARGAAVHATGDVSWMVGPRRVAQRQPRRRSSAGATPRRCTGRSPRVRT